VAARLFNVEQLANSAILPMVLERVEGSNAVAAPGRAGRH
jgi:hypothetical protein